jgi:hypothetical protein
MLPTSLLLEGGFKLYPKEEEILLLVEFESLYDERQSLLKTLLDSWASARLRRKTTSGDSFKYNPLCPAS